MLGFAEEGYEDQKYLFAESQGSADLGGVTLSDVEAESYPNVYVTASGAEVLSRIGLPFSPRAPPVLLGVATPLRSVSLRSLLHRPRPGDTLNENRCATSGQDFRPEARVEAELVLGAGQLQRGLQAS